MIDWDVALATATTLTQPGPDASADEVEAIVAQLRQAATRAQEPVREFTGLQVAVDTAPVLVVDRSGWLEANVATFRTLVTPLVDKITGERDLGPVARAIGGKVSGAEVGTLLSYLSSKVLGQFDPFGTDPFGTDTGRLLLVAPNIMAAERKLGVDPGDFRQWVCLHEETHRVQFTAVPWLADHMHSLMDSFADASEFSAQRLAASLGEIVAVARGQSNRSLADVLQTPEQKAILDQITGVMSLLEGHADVVMDGVGPSVIATVAHIRRLFEGRRSGGSPLDRVVRRLLGLEAKMRQYRDGAAFVRAVVDKVAMADFNVVWERAENLPTKSEIHDPAAWVKRVHG